MCPQCMNTDGTASKHVFTCLLILNRITVSPQDYGKKYEGDSMDLRLDIERRKKIPKREGGKGSAGSRTPSRELSPDKVSKHKKSK